MNPYHLLIHSKHMDGSWTSYSTAVFLTRIKRILKENSTFQSLLSHQATLWKVRTTGSGGPCWRKLSTDCLKNEMFYRIVVFCVHALEEMQQNICLFSTVSPSSLPQHLFSPSSDVITYIRKVKYLQQFRQTQQMPLTVPLGNPSLWFSFQGTTRQVFFPINK